MGDIGCIEYRSDFPLIKINILLKGLFWIRLEFLNAYRYIYFTIIFYFKAYCDFINVGVLAELELPILSIADNLNS